MKILTPIIATTLVAASATLANAGEVKTSLLPTLNSASDISLITGTPSGWNEAIGNSGITAAVVTTDLLASSTLASEGWHWGKANLNGGLETDLSNVSSTGFTFIGRQAYAGEFVAATISLSSLGMTDGDVLTGLSLSFTTTAGVTNSTYGIYSWNGTTATEIAKQNVSTARTSGQSVSLAGTDLSLSASDKIFVIFNSSSTGITDVISNLTSSATYTTATIPEPSIFGVLAGLGALALVGARRRRK